jgi:3-methyladenine DNA glycosylase Tag
MVAFAPIRKAAEKRLGVEGLAARLPAVKTTAELKAVGDDRYLSLMSLRVFRAGLKHEMVEEAFRGFDPRRVRAMSEEDVEKLMDDRRLIRHLGKLRSVPANAAAIGEIAAEHGSFAAWLASWPEGEMVGLWDALGKRFSQMGGNSGPYFLRMAGKDTFILTPAVVAGLNRWEAFAGEPKGKAARGQVQSIFNAWAAEMGAPLAHLSVMLAASVD